MGYGQEASPATELGRDECRRSGIAGPAALSQTSGRVSLSANNCWILLKAKSNNLAEGGGYK